MAFFVLAGRTFGKEDLNQPAEGYREPLTTSKVKKPDGFIEPRGNEDGNITYYGDEAGLQSTGAWNSFFGFKTGRDNSGDANTFVGALAGRDNEGGGSCFFGFYSGLVNQGNFNSFYGSSAGLSNTTGYENTFIGYNTGLYNTGGSKNTFVGYQAGFNNIYGWENTFSGYQAGWKNTGYWNTFNGYSAGYNNTTGYWNTCVGYEAGLNNQTGSYNVFLGAKAGRNEPGSHKLYIDSSDTATPLIYGEFDNRFLRINGNFTATATSISSDKRWKKEIEPIESPLKKVSEIRGVRYRWKVDEFPNRGLSDGRQIGLIAQDVERVMPELVSEGKDGYKAVSYSKLTAVLVEAVKELKNENQKQKELLQKQAIQFQKQQAEIEELRSLINNLKSYHRQIAKR